MCWVLTPVCVLWAVPLPVPPFSAKQMEQQEHIEPQPHLPPAQSRAQLLPAPRIEGRRQCQVQAEPAWACWTLPGSPGGVCPSLAEPLCAAKADKGTQITLGNEEGAGLGPGSRGAAGTGHPIGERRGSSTLNSGCQDLLDQGCSLPCAALTLFLSPSAARRAQLLGLCVQSLGWAAPPALHTQNSAPLQLLLYCTSKIQPLGSSSCITQ